MSFPFPWPNSVKDDSSRVHVTEPIAELMGEDESFPGISLSEQFPPWIILIEVS